jgi:putative transposase
MSHNYYSELHIHAVWHTLGSRPLLTPAIEPAVHVELRRRCNEIPGIIIHAIDGTLDHVHLCLTIPPTLTISEFIGQLKGGSSHHINHNNLTRDKLLEWQTGYGVLSFGTKDLAWVKEYVLRQKEHHRVGRVFDRLERITSEEEAP